jgi:hypothetical protein
MSKIYPKYRTWASGIDKRSSVVIGAISGVIGSIVAAFSTYSFGEEFILWKLLPIVFLVVGPICTFDAWEAAAHRGANREGIIRAAFIMCACWGFALYGLAIHS